MIDYRYLNLERSLKQFCFVIKQLGQWPQTAELYFRSIFRIKLSAYEPQLYSSYYGNYSSKEGDQQIRYIGTHCIIAFLFWCFGLVLILSKPGSIRLLCLALALTIIAFGQLIYVLAAAVV
jgi:hypothetical protein